MCSDKTFWLNTFILFVLLSNTEVSLAADFNPVAPAPSADVVDANTKANLMTAISRANLSPAAKNIQVIPDDGTLILRGVVKDDRERQTISTLAEQNGCTNIKNELKVQAVPKRQVASKRTGSKKPLIITRSR